jgi:hypothetical protein
MLRSVLAVVGMISGLQVLGQFAEFKYLEPIEARTLQPDNWYLFKSDQVSKHDLVVRELKGGWVIGRPQHPSVKGKIFHTNNQWKWASKIRGLSGKSAKEKRQYVLIFSEIPSELKQVAKKLPHQNAIRIESTKTAIESYWLKHPNLLWVDSHEIPKEESILRRHDLSVNDIYLAHHLHGKNFGVPTSIKEQRFRLDDLDIAYLSDTTERSYPSISSHATDMATLVSGQGISFLHGTGVSSSSLISTSFELLFPEPADYFTSYQCEVQNHSFGIGVENYYGAEARAYDEISNELSALLHVFSSGNSGEFTALEGKYTGLLKTANLTGTFKQAKNVLVVGATDSMHLVKSYSSVGPAYDGRIKPELVAYGGEGSSDAAAVVSGMASYLKGFAASVKGRSLSSQETKALLIAGAKDLREPGPDFQSGYGSASLSNSLDILIADNYLTDSLLTGANEHKISIGPGVNSLKVLLYWNDPAATLEADQALVNDLDLMLTDLEGNKIRPWVLSDHPHKDSLNLPARRGEDHLNNVEMITLNNPAPGEYTLNLSSSTTLVAPQSYTIAFDIQEDEVFNWTYPTSSDHIIAGEPIILRWKSTLDSSAIGRLFWQWEDSTYQETLNEVKISDERIGVIAPDSIGKGKWVLELNGLMHTTDILWTEAIPELEVMLNCEDQLILRWEDLAPVNETTVFSPAEPFVQVDENDTSVSIDPSQLTSDFVAIRHTYEEKLGIRSYAINYQQQGVGCYLSSFIIRSSEENSVTLDIQLNAIELISSVSIEKINPSGSSSFFDIASPTASVVLDDPDVATGIYNYRVVIGLKNGGRVLSEYQTVYFANQASSLVFPNPVSPSSELAVMSDAAGGVFQLIDLNGKLSLQWDISNSIEYIPLNSIRQGLYTYRIISTERILSKGKIMIK